MSISSSASPLGRISTGEGLPQSLDLSWNTVRVMTREMAEETLFRHLAKVDDVAQSELRRAFQVHWGWNPDDPYFGLTGQRFLGKADMGRSHDAAVANTLDLFLKALERHPNLMYQGNGAILFTGARSSSLLGFTQWANRSDDRPEVFGLIPTGQLWNMQRAPFCGELAFGLNGNNVDHLSMTHLGAIDRALGYAQMVSGSHESNAATHEQLIKDSDEVKVRFEEYVASWQKEIRAQMEENAVEIGTITAAIITVEKEIRALEDNLENDPHWDEYVTEWKAIQPQISAVEARLTAMQAIDEVKRYCAGQRLWLRTPCVVREYTSLEREYDAMRARSPCPKAERHLAHLRYDLQRKQAEVQSLRSALDTLPAELDADYTDNHLFFRTQLFERRVQLWDMLSPEDKDLVRLNFPVLYGVRPYRKGSTDASFGDIGGEVLLRDGVQGREAVSRELKVAFVPRENVARVQGIFSKAVATQNVQVYPIEELEDRVLSERYSTRLQNGVV